MRALPQRRQVAEIPSEPKDIIEMWAGKFRQGAARMLSTIAERYPDPIEKEEFGGHHRAHHLWRHI